LGVEKQLVTIDVPEALGIAAIVCKVPFLDECLNLLRIHPYPLSHQRIANRKTHGKQNSEPS
jgi:hypothetical protein